MAIWRRVQRTGGGSFSVTLPKSWAQRLGVREGSMISLIVNEDGSLRLVPEGVQAKPAAAEIVVRDSSTVTRDIIGGYLLGFDTIVAESSSPFTSEALRSLRQTVRRLVGAEIVEEFPQKVVVKVLLDPRAVAPEIVLRREAALVHRMIIDSVNALVESNVPLAKAVSERDEEVDRQYFTLVRMIRSAIRSPDIGREGTLSRLRLLDLRLAARLLEDSGDEASSLGQDVARSSGLAPGLSVVKTLRRLGETVAELTREATAAFLAEDHALTVTVISRYEEFTPQMPAAEREAAQADPQVRGLLSKALARLEHIAANAYDIAELVSPAAVKHPA